MELDKVGGQSAREIHSSYIYTNMDHLMYHIAAQIHNLINESEKFLNSNVSPMHKT